MNSFQFPMPNVQLPVHVAFKMEIGNWTLAIGNDPFLKGSMIFSRNLHSIGLSGSI